MSEKLQADTYWQLALDGVENAQLRFGTQADCMNSITEINLPGVYTCTLKTALKAPAVSPPTTPPPPPPPQTSTTPLSQSRSIDNPGVLAKPAKGSAFTDPNYGSPLRRVSDHAADGMPGMAITDYSRRQSFNSNNSKFILYAGDGSWHLYDATTFARIKQLAGPSGDAEPQWSPTDPDKLIYLPTNGVGMVMKELSVSANTSRTVADLGARLKAIWPTAAAMWTKSEGSSSKDGRYWAFMVESVAANYNMDTVGLVTYDLQTDTITGRMNVTGNRPDHVSMSPSGNYAVASWANSTGTIAYTRDFSGSRKVHTTSEHSDLAIDANGDDVYVSIDYQSAKGDLFMVNLRTGVRTVLLSTYAPSSATALHISGKAFNKPGFVIVSTYAGEGMQWFFNKVMAVQLAPAPKIYNLAFHRAVPNGYYTEPHATVNRDFTKILFNSNFGVNSATDLDSYQIEVNPALL